jgi:hypothetical protein
MSERLRANSDRLIAAAVLLAIAAIVVVSFAPGRMNVDTLYQINEIVHGDFTNQHAPVLEALWKPFYDLGIGPGGVLVGQVLAFLAGGYLILRAALRRIPAAVIVAAIALFPPVFLMLGTLMRDTWFTALLVLMTGLAIRAVGSAPRYRVAWVVATIVVAWLTLAARQNAAPAVAPIGIVLAYVLLGEARSSWRRLALATGFAVVMIAGMVASQALIVRAIEARDINPEQYLYVYDVGAASVREGEILFPPDVMPRRDYDLLEESFTVDNVIPLIFGEEALVATPLADGAFESLRDAWTEQLTGDPLGYLGSRFDLFAQQLSIGYEPVLVAPEETSFGYAHWVPDANEAANSYLDAFTRSEQDFFVKKLWGDPLFAVWVYLLLSIATCAVLLRRGMPPALLIAGALALSSVTLQIGLFFGAMGVAYRFEFSVVAAALLTLPLAVVAIGRRRGVEIPFQDPAVAEA